MRDCGSSATREDPPPPIGTYYTRIGGVWKQTRTLYVGVDGQTAAGVLPQNLLALVSVHFHLSPYHRVVDAARGHQRLMRPLLNHAPILHQQDEVGAPDG